MALDKIKAIIAEKIDLDPETITEDSSFEDMEVDSLDMVEIVMDIEEEFDISIEAEDEIKTVGDLVKLIEA
ncbi:MAG: acyl carrier protein [Christensenellaceae bacterium]|jgi:acyl carrier protein